MKPSGLAARIIAFLSVTLLPFGLVAVLQTAQLNEETRARSELRLVALTQSVAAVEREAVLRALGAARALGATLSMADGSNAACSRFLSSYLEASPEYVFAGVLPPSGVMRCSTVAREMDFSDYPGFDTLVAAPRATVLRNDSAPGSGASVVVVSEPFGRAGELGGFVTLSIPTKDLAERLPPENARGFEAVLTFNVDGQILTARGRRDDLSELLPEGASLEWLFGSAARSFSAESVDGTTRVFAVAPLVPGLVYSLGIWASDNAAAAPLAVNKLAIALPLAMWAASVVVAFLAINRLVIRHIHTLSRRMRAFAVNRRIPADATQDNMAQELRDIEDDFLAMANAILRDEAQQENALREKTILLKEVHHRVKNNLQLISSIMNMQIRQSDSDETRAVLSRLQERIRSLATIHRNLYQTEDLSHVDAGQLLRDLMGQMSHMAGSSASRVDIETDADPIEIFPDQAVPLSLLTAEAATNALKHAGRHQGDRLKVCVSLKQTGERSARLEVTNSISPTESEQDDSAVEPAGLGTRLIRAFATQLGGTLDQGPNEDGSRYSVTVEFTLTDFIPEAQDY